MWRAAYSHRPAKTYVPSSIGPTAPPSDTPNDTNMADDTRRSVRSMVHLTSSSVCRCLRRLQAPHVYSTSSHIHQRSTRGINVISHVLDRRRHLLKGPSSRREARQARASSTRLRYSFDSSHACFRRLCAPHVQIMTSIRIIVHVLSPPTHIDPRKHPCRPQSGRRRLRAIH